MEEIHKALQESRMGGTVYGSGVQGRWLRGDIFKMRPRAASSELETEFTCRWGRQQGQRCRLPQPPLPIAATEHEVHSRRARPGSFLRVL